MDFEELMNWIRNSMNLTQKKNYQIVMLRALLKNDENKRTKKEIQEELHECNPERSVEFFQGNHSVFDALIKNKVAKSIESGKSYQLILEQPLTGKERSALIEECDIMIKKGPEKILEERDGHKYILSELEEFYGKVGIVQLEVLSEISRIKGKTRSGKQLGWSSKGDGRLKSKRVSEPYLIHPLGRGTFTPADSKFAQSIFLSPRTIWDLEIVRERFGYVTVNKTIRNIRFEEILYSRRKCLWDQCANFSSSSEI